VLYVYAATHAERACPTGTGVCGAPVRMVRCGRVGALVSDLAAAPRPDRPALQAHGDVVQRAMADGPVIPFRFGHLAMDEPQLRQSLSRQESMLRRLLDRLTGHVELLVSLRHDPEELLGAVLSADPALRRLQSAARSRGVGAQVDFGRRLAAAVEQRRIADAAAVVNAVRGRVSASVVERVDDAWVRAGLLVRATDAKAVEDHVRQGEWPAAEVRVTGPLPPYHFAAA
jgi:hypothetical protein